MVLRPKYSLIDKITRNITLSGRRCKSHGSSKEGSGKEEVMHSIIILTLFLEKFES